MAPGMPRRVARRRHVASHCATARRLTRTTRVAGTLGCSAVRADVFMPGEHLQMASDRETDGGKVLLRETACAWCVLFVPIRPACPAFSVALSASASPNFHVFV